MPNGLLTSRLVAAVPQFKLGLVGIYVSHTPDSGEGIGVQASRPRGYFRRMPEQKQGVHRQFLNPKNVVQGSTPFSNFDSWRRKLEVGLEASRLHSDKIQESYTVPELSHAQSGSLLSCDEYPPNLDIDNPAHIYTSMSQPQMKGPGLLYVPAEPGPSLTEDAFHDWYNNYHGPLRIRLPFIKTGLRYKASDGEKPTWLAWYDIEDLAQI